MTDKLSKPSWQHGVLVAAMDYLAMLAALVGLVTLFTCQTEHFLSRDTFLAIANQYSSHVIIAVGMTFVLILGGIDLSVGSVLALAGAVIGVSMVKYQWSAPVAILAGLATGLLCGLFNGLVSVRWRLPSFIVTLGMLEIARGGTQLVTNYRTQFIGPAIGTIGEATVKGLPLPMLLALGVVVLGQLLLSRTVFGRYVVAIGTNEEAVRLSGINPRPVKVAVFTLCGLLSGLAAVIHTSRQLSADPTAGSGFELQAIAAVVIGGTSLMGGRGSVVRSLIGVLIIAVLDAGLAQVGVQDHIKRLITGAVIIAAVILDYYRQRIGTR